MYKSKAQTFRQQIRRQYLNDYFKKKRKELFNYSLSEGNRQEDQNVDEVCQKLQMEIKNNGNKVSDEGRFSLEELAKVCTLSSTEFGVAKLLQTQIPPLILPYLCPKYYNTTLQHMATTIFVNITYLRPSQLPSNQFMRNFINIIQNTQPPSSLQQQFNTHHNPSHLTSQQAHDVIDNCLLTIYHLMLQFPQATRFYIQQTTMIPLLFNMLDCPCHTFIIEKIMKILDCANSYYAAKKQLAPIRRFLKFYINVFVNMYHEKVMGFLTLHNVNQVVMLATLLVEEDGKGVYNIEEHQKKVTQLLEIQGIVAKSPVLNVICASFAKLKHRHHMLKEIIIFLKLIMSEFNPQMLQKKVIRLLCDMFDYLHDPKQPNSLTQQTQPLPQQQRFHMLSNYYQTIFTLQQTHPDLHKLIKHSPLYHRLSSRLQELTETIDSHPNHNQLEFMRSFIYIFGFLTVSGYVDSNDKRLLQKLCGKMMDRMHDVEYREENQQDDQLQAYIGMIGGYFGEEEVLI